MNWTDLPAAARFALRRIPRRHHEDAAQEARLALLEGRSPAAAVRNYWRSIAGTRRALGSIESAAQIFDDEVTDGTYRRPPFDPANGIIWGLSDERQKTKGNNSRD